MGQDVLLITALVSSVSCYIEVYENIYVHVNAGIGNIGNTFRNIALSSGVKSEARMSQSQVITL